jgi:miniconductance mechanosensitive channel
LAVIVLFFCVVTNYLTKKFALKFIVSRIKKNKITWDDILVESGVLRRLSHIVPIAIIQLFSDSFGKYTKYIQKGVGIYLTIIALLVIDSLIDAIDKIYSRYEISKVRPIKGLLQVAKIASFIIGGIVIIADFMGQSPVVMLGGIGALTAVFSLVFKDSLLGFVAGIQLSANDMVRIGDWIEMPKHNANGDVIEISLNTVKVRNFDKTITTIPAYALISDSFKNWRGMKSIGARRIMRSVYIDVNSIRFCTPEMLEKLKNSGLLKEYIESRQAEIDEYNKSRGLDPVNTVNARRLTNIGVFRVYIQNYLKNHPGIHQDMLQIVRQLPPEANGLPLQIYAFTNTTEWPAYENIQSDIFDHILSVAGYFGLRVFQNPSGHDLKIFKNEN